MSAPSLRLEFLIEKARDDTSSRKAFVRALKGTRVLVRQVGWGLWKSLLYKSLVVVDVALEGSQI